MDQNILDAHIAMNKLRNLLKSGFPDTSRACSRPWGKKHNGVKNALIVTSLENLKGPHTKMVELIV